MNSEFSSTEPKSESHTTLPTAIHAIESSMDDDFADEILGERQGSACSMEPGCTSCE